MRNIIKSIILALLLVITFSQVNAGIFDDEIGQMPYCTGDDSKCGYGSGVEQVGTVIDDIEKTKSLSEYIQDIVKFLLTFVSIIAVIYIIYAGFKILTSNGNEDNLKKSKSTILYVIIGIVVMWLAYPIIKWVLDVLNLGAVTATT